jgi:hypothetical protein
MSVVAQPSSRAWLFDSVLAGIVERGAIALRLGLRLLERDPIVGRFDLEQHIAPMHELIVRDRQFDDRPATSGAIVTT